MSKLILSVIAFALVLKYIQAGYLGGGGGGLSIGGIGAWGWDGYGLGGPIAYSLYGLGHLEGLHGSRVLSLNRALNTAHAADAALIGGFALGYGMPPVIGGKGLDVGQGKGGIPVGQAPMVGQGPVVGQAPMVGQGPVVGQAPMVGQGPIGKGLDIGQYGGGFGGFGGIGGFGGVIDPYVSGAWGSAGFGGLGWGGLGGIAGYGAIGGWGGPLGVNPWAVYGGGWGTDVLGIAGLENLNWGFIPSMGLI